MFTDQQSPKTRSALARCYRLLLRLAREIEDHDAVLDFPTIAASSESTIGDKVVPERAEITDVTA